MAHPCRSGNIDHAAPIPALSGRSGAGERRPRRAWLGAGLSGLVVWAACAGPALGQSGGAPEGRRPALGWSGYTNERFGTEVDVPTALFEVAHPLSRGADGHHFRTRDGRADLRVSGSFAPRVAGSFEAYRRLVIQDEPTMSYRAGGASWFVLSGRQRGEIRYTKVIDRCGAAHSVFLRYPASQKRFYDPIVTRVSSSLSARCTTR